MAVNTAFDWLTLAVMLGANVFLVAYVFRAVGKEAFGVYRLVVSLSLGAMYLSFGMANTVIRLASENLAVEDWEPLSRRMSAARAYLIGAAGLTIVAFMLGSPLLLKALKVPADLQDSAGWLVRLAGFSVALRLVVTLHRGLLQAAQRFDLSAGAFIAEALLRAGLVVVCFESGWISLKALGVSMAVSSLVGLALHAGFVRLALPKLHMSFRKLAWGPAREVLSFGGWGAVGDGARQALDQGSVLAVGATLGLVQAGVFSVPMMLCTYVLQVPLRMLRTMRPTATALSMRGQREPLMRLYKSGTRIALTSLALEVTVLAFFGLPFLRYWLGPEMESAYAPLLVLLGLTYLRGAGGVAEQWVFSVGPIRGLAISRAVAAAAGLAIGVAIGVWTDWGLPAMVAGFYVPTALRAVLHMPWIIRRHVGVPVLVSLFVCLLPPLLAALVPAAAGLAISAVWPAGSFIEVLVQMALVSCAYLPVVWWLMFTRQERRVIAGVFRPGRKSPG